MYWKDSNIERSFKYYNMLNISSEFTYFNNYYNKLTDVNLFKFKSAKTIEKQFLGEDILRMAKLKIGNILAVPIEPFISCSAYETRTKNY